MPMTEETIPEQIEAGKILGLPDITAGVILALKNGKLVVA